MQGTIATFSRLGLLTVSASSYARDVDNLGGATGTGILLNAGVAANVRRVGNVLSFVINAGLDTSGFIVGVLASDTQHGARGGGTLHADVIAGGASGFMSGADKTKLDGISGVFGLNFSQTSDETTTTNATSTYTNGNKVTLTTGALTGTFRLEWTAELTVANNVARYLLRLYNNTTATELNLNDESVGTSGIWQTRSGFIYVTLTGTSQTYILQFASQNNSTTISCRRARMGFFRVS